MKNYKNRLVVFGLVVICLLITGCGNEVREVASTDSFKDVLSTNNFTVTDNSSSYDSYDYILSSSVAKYDEIEIEMIVYDTSESANKVQEGHIDSFNLLKSTGANENKDKGKNYYRYVLISNGYYMISSRVENTLIFCKTNLDNKATVENVLGKLGY